MLTRIVQGLHVATQPHRMLGIALGTRMTVLTLPDRSLLVHSPIEPTRALRDAIDALGEVSTIVASNMYHHMYAGAFHLAYPKAKLVGPRGLRTKRPDLRFSAHFGETGALPDAVAGVDVPSMLRETVLYVPSLKTVVSSDLTENFETSDHLPTRLYLKATGIHGKPGIATPLRAMFRDRAGARCAIDEILALDFDRVILAHGRILEAGGRNAVRETYHWLRA